MEEIEAQEESDPLSGAMAEAVDASLLSYDELQARVMEMEHAVMTAFEKASEEPKLTSRGTLMLSNSAPLQPKKETSEAKAAEVGAGNAPGRALGHAQAHDGGARRNTESKRWKGIYIGEDVEHGATI